MKIILSRIIISDRFILVTAAVSVMLALFLLISLISTGNITRKNERLKKELEEMQILSDELDLIKDAVVSRERKIGLTRVNSVVSALEDSLKNLGIKAKVIKPLGKKNIKEYQVEDGEMQIENIDLNRIVNLLYKLENSPVPLKINETVISKTFEDQDSFIVKLTASLISK
jgi:hypothetical protein